jgi:hypothetical protein
LQSARLVAAVTELGALGGFDKDGTDGDPARLAERLAYR